MVLQLRDFVIESADFIFQNFCIVLDVFPRLVLEPRGGLNVHGGLTVYQHLTVPLPRVVLVVEVRNTGLLKLASRTLLQNLASSQFN